MVFIDPSELVFILPPLLFMRLLLRIVLLSVPFMSPMRSVVEFIVPLLIVPLVLPLFIVPLVVPLLIVPLVVKFHAG